MLARPALPIEYEPDGVENGGAAAVDPKDLGLRRRLAEDDLRQRMEAWVKELRAGAEVRYNP